jgi:hypothetical protein
MIFINSFHDLRDGRATQKATAAKVREAKKQAVAQVLHENKLARGKRKTSGERN